VPEGTIVVLIINILCTTVGRAVRRLDQHGTRVGLNDDSVDLQPSSLARRIVNSVAGSNRYVPAVYWLTVA